MREVGTVVLLIITPLVAMLVGMAGSSSVQANIPAVEAMIVLVKGYCVATEVLPVTALSPNSADWPALTLPIFLAVMVGGDPGRQRDPHWSLRQRGECGHFRRARTAHHFRDLCPVWNSPDCLSDLPLGTQFSGPAPAHPTLSATRRFHPGCVQGLQPLSGSFTHRGISVGKTG